MARLYKRLALALILVIVAPGFVMALDSIDSANDVIDEGGDPPGEIEEEEEIEPDPFTIVLSWLVEISSRVRGLFSR